MFGSFTVSSFNWEVDKTYITSTCQADPVILEELHCVRRVTSNCAEMSLLTRMHPFMWVTRNADLESFVPRVRNPMIKPAIWKMVIHSAHSYYTFISAHVAVHGPYGVRIRGFPLCCHKIWGWYYFMEFFDSYLIITYGVDIAPLSTRAYSYCLVLHSQF